ncbi:MAG TPA: YfhO family protein [Candidatus Acidoferrales bacterium]|nr:YfhO family protein [Candidatus Acidoferrales bacterium]
MMKKFIVPVLFAIIIGIFFYPFFLHGRLPIPSDTIVGLYHPFRDLYAKEYPNGIPYKNFLITDPVRQQYPWRNLAITIEKQAQLPLWNPYSFAGTLLLANFQSAVFYPLNIFLFIFPFWLGWSLLVFLQPLLAGLFLYLYLRYMKLSLSSSLLGGIVFAFCGFSVSWLEWNSVIQVALWLPVILLAKEHILKKVSYKWMAVLIFAQCAAFFAGHIQLFFYMLLLHASYLIVRIIQITRNEGKQTHFWKRAWKRYLPFVIHGLIVILITSLQWFPTLQYIFESARGADQANSWLKDGWFIPWQHLIQFVSPDFFGNPATLNYWGTWNYGELVGYVGIGPLIIALYAMFFRKDKKTLFFGTIFFLSLIFSLPTIFAKLPFIWNIPFLSTSQPTRLLFLTDFSLAVLAALGFDYYFHHEKKFKIIYPILFIGFIFVLLWSYILKGYIFTIPISPDHVSIAKHNLYLPTGLYLCISLLLLLYSAIANKKFHKKYYLAEIFSCIIILIVIFDVFRFFWKFDPFTERQYLFPSTKTLSYLQNQHGQFRIMETDSRILPPNFSVMYHLQSLDGYDPLYLQRYGELIIAMERNKPDIHTPFGFDRIITPTNTSSRLINLFGIKYVVSLTDIRQANLVKVFSEGQTQIYKNTKAFPRVFFVTSLKSAGNKNVAIQLLFDKQLNLRKTAVVEGWDSSMKNFTNGTAHINNYQANSVSITVKSTGNTFLVLTDTYYPTWHVTVDGKSAVIYRTDYNFRGVFIPKGEHAVIFSDNLF